MRGLDLMGASPLPALGAAGGRRASWDEVIAPEQVILSPRGAQSTIFGDPMRGIPSGVARVIVQSGNFWIPSYAPSHKIWDNTSGPLTPQGSGPAPSATVYFANGQKRTFAGMAIVDITGGQLRRGIIARSWFARVFALGAGGGDPQVRAVQAALKAAGFDPQGIDGIMGPHTEAAITAFWASKEQSHAPVIDADLLAALNISTPAVEPPADGRPAKGWSQPQPGAMGPAITPSTPGSAAGTTDAVSAAPVSKGVFVAIAGAVIVVVGGLLLIFSGGKKRR